MAELTIRPEEIREALDNFVKTYTPTAAAREEVGTVVTSGDGIARVEGLPSAMANELLEFENGTLGIALNLDVREIGVVVMGGVLLSMVLTLVVVPAVYTVVARNTRSPQYWTRIIERMRGATPPATPEPRTGE